MRDFIMSYDFLKANCLFRLCEFRNFVFKKTRSKVTYLMEAKFLVLIFFKVFTCLFLRYHSGEFIEATVPRCFAEFLKCICSLSEEGEKEWCGYLKMSLTFYEVFPLESFSVEFEAVGVQLFSNKSHHVGIN